MNIIKHIFAFFLQNRYILANAELELANSKIIQTQLFLTYQQVKQSSISLPSINDVGFRVFSQNDEDGILLYIFSLIGTKNKKCIEIASGTPYGANTTNLICNWGWYGLLVESDKKAIEQSISFYKNHKDTFLYPPVIQHDWVTKENVNKILENNKFTGTVDLLSLDLDGVDYWVWNHIKVISPRVIVVEYRYIWGEKKSVTVPYKSDFDRFDTHPHYYGASLSAFVKLARKKGYRLVGCNKYGLNAFFIKNGVGEKYLPEIPVHNCFAHPRTKDGVEAMLNSIKNFKWEKV